MKNKTKQNKTKQIRLLMFLFFAVFYSCEKDLYEGGFKPESNQKANVRTSTLNELFKNKEFVSSYKKLPKKNNSSSEFSRSTFEENNGFTIVDETVRVVETDNVTTYTLLIESDDNTKGNLENLVLYSELQDGELGYVIEYHSLSDLGLTEEEIIENGIKDVDGILTDDNTAGKVVFYHNWVAHCIRPSTSPYFCGGVPGTYFLEGQCGHWESGYIFIDEDGGGSGGSGGGGSGDIGGGYLGSGGGTGTGGGIPTSPVLISSSANRDKCFNKKLSTEQQDWLYDNPVADSTITQYLENTIEDEFQGCYDEEVINNVKNYINQSMVNDGLDLNFEYSLKSPFFIDMNSVSGNTPEEVKFREVYGFLMQSPKFKELFYDLFNNTPLFNVKFTIENITQQFGPNNYIKGKCKLSYTNGHPVPFNNIVIDRNFILTKTKSEIVTTIIHECIHAYLNIKFLNPNIGMSINNINDLDFQECINEYYANFSGTQTQHSFFVDYMIPTMVEILNDVKNDIFTTQQISAVEYPASNALIYGVTQTNPSVKDYNVVLPWNWTNYFTHLCFSGLESSTSYLSIYPHGSPNELNSQQYISIGTFIFN